MKPEYEPLCLKVHNIAALIIFSLKGMKPEYEPLCSKVHNIAALYHFLPERYEA